MSVRGDTLKEGQLEALRQFHPRQLLPLAPNHEEVLRGSDIAQLSATAPRGRG